MYRAVGEDWEDEIAALFAASFPRLCDSLVSQVFFLLYSPQYFLTGMSYRQLKLVAKPIK